MQEESSTIPPIGLAADLAGASADQRRVVDLIASGPRGAVPSPFLAMLDSPDLAEVIQAVGATIRFRSTLPDALRKIAILTTAGAMPCGYEWNFHAPIAVAAGVAPAVIAATRPGADAASISGAEGTIIALCREIAADHVASSVTLARAIDQIGRTGTTEVIAIAGYYALLANFIRTAGHDQPFVKGEDAPDYPLPPSREREGPAA
jgi:4-carboxymuconolactone decarboxylase